MISCYSRFLAECGLPIFGLKDTNGKVIHLGRTFASRSIIIWITKFLLVAFAISGMTLDILGQATPEFYLAFFTNWGEVIGTTYLILSFMTSVGCIPVKSKEDKHGITIIAWTTKILWGLFPAIIVSQTVIVLVYWLTVYSGDTIYYTTLYGHGLLFAAIAMDGLILNRTPLRMKQIIFPYLIAAPYAAWSILHGVATDLGNPNRTGGEETEEDDDALYGVLNWTERPVTAAIVLTILLGAAVPIFFVLFWSISLILPRRYVSNEEQDLDVDDSTDVFHDEV